MRMAGRWAARNSAHGQDRVDQLTGIRLTEGNYRGRQEVKPAATPDDQARSGANPEAPLELDQEQARIVLAALEDAAVLRREAIGNCPDCRSARERLCADHQGGWETGEEYDSLRWLLDSTCRAARADRESEAATEPELAEYVPPAAPGTGRCVPPQIGNAIADHTRAVNGPKTGQDRAPYVSPEEEASHAEPLTEDQTIGRNEANYYLNEVADYQPDREAGQ